MSSRATCRSSGYDDSEIFNVVGVAGEPSDVGSSGGTSKLPTQRPTARAVTAINALGVQLPLPGDRGLFFIDVTWRKLVLRVAHAAIEDVRVDLKRQRVTVGGGLKVTLKVVARDCFIDAAMALEARNHDVFKILSIGVGNHIQIQRLDEGASPGRALIGHSVVSPSVATNRVDVVTALVHRFDLSAGVLDASDISVNCFFILCPGDVQV
ncbi:hypothetical protein [Agromyces allii]|uniref:hypothetical protein n=1 Tax=Agromyces allii TaxID=393607 RepID=UPI0014781FBB|nr:hypothetical protein [Agromyces allii]